MAEDHIPKGSAPAIFIFGRLFAYPYLYNYIN